MNAQRWTGACWPHKDGGFVAVSDYQELAAILDAESLAGSIKTSQIIKLLHEIEAFGKALLKAEAERDALRAAAQPAYVFLTDLGRNHWGGGRLEIIAALNAALEQTK